MRPTTQCPLSARWSCRRRVFVPSGENRHSSPIGLLPPPALESMILPAMRRLILLAIVAGGRAVPGGARAGAISIFFYPWYGNAAADGSYLHWQQSGHAPPTDIASSFYPARGLYSSGERRVLAGQMAEIARAGVDQVVSSWWGWGSIEDQRLPAVVAVATRRHMSVAVQIEPYDGRTAQSVAADIEHCRTLGIGELYV